jgi:hypothetical protein
MARMRKPENESFEQARVRQILETISNNPSRSEKMAWNRKMDNMVKLFTEIQPIEQQILELISKKGPIMDKIDLLRQDMTSECVHPFEYLVFKDDHCLCKFCNRKICIPNEYKNK